MTAPDTASSSFPKRIWGELRHDDEIALSTSLRLTDGRCETRVLSFDFNVILEGRNAHGAKRTGGPFRVLYECKIVRESNVAVSKRDTSTPRGWVADNVKILGYRVTDEVGFSIILV
jgi:hypothetical protein